MAAGKKKRSTEAARKRKRVPLTPAQKGWVTRRKREAEEARAAKERSDRAKRAAETKRRKARERERILDEARGTVERLTRRARSAVETASEAADELKEARDENATQSHRREKQTAAVENADRAYYETQELHKAVRDLARLEGEKPKGRKRVTSAAQGVASVLEEMMTLAAGSSDGPAWGRIRVHWYDAKRRLFAATGRDYAHFIDVLNAVAEASETDWQIAYGIES